MEEYKFWESLQNEMCVEKKFFLRKRVTEGNIWLSTMMPALHVDFGGVHVSLLCLLTNFCILSHFYSISSSSTHSTAETDSYSQDFTHCFSNCC